jgi:hypothetical protein
MLFSKDEKQKLKGADPVSLFLFAIEGTQFVTGNSAITYRCNSRTVVLIRHG